MLKKYTLEVLKECNCIPPQGPFDKIKAKYSLIWEEYIILWRYTCLVGRINQDLLNKGRGISETTKLLVSAISKLPRRDYAILFSGLGFQPPVRWDIKTFRSMSYELHTPSYFVPEKDGVMAIFYDMTGLPEITEISIYKNEHEVVVPPNYEYNFQMFDVDYSVNGNLFAMYEKTKSREDFKQSGGNLLKEILHKDFFKVKNAAVSRKKWNPDKKIDIFGNNILHYIVGTRQYRGAEKYLSLLNTPNDVGITPAMKLLSSGQYSVFIDYSDQIDFKKRDSFGRNMLFYFAMLTVMSDEQRERLKCLKLIAKMIPNAVTETDSAGYTVFHYCNFVDMFIEIESVSRNKINISDDVFSKIFVCYPTNDFDKRVYSNSLMDKMFEICMRYDAKLTQHTFYFFSRSIHGLKLLDRNSLLREKVEDRDTVFHVFLDNIESAKRLSDYARDMRVIKYLVSRVPINSTNDFGETPSMFLPSRQRYRDFSHDLREMGADFFKENIFGKTQSSYYFTCFNDDKN